MKIILFAGGTGKRFWPVSRIKSPKQFLPIVNDKPLLRLRYEILRKGYRAEDIFISTGDRYRNEVTKMIPEIPKENFIFEPEMKDTGPAVTYAVGYVSMLHPNEVISIQWTDHLIKKEDVFLDALKESEQIVKKEHKVALLAVPARFASPHRGYIHMGAEIKSVNKDISEHDFVEFVEKPSKKVAEKYLEDAHYAWNPGYWTLSAEKFMETLKSSRPDFLKAIQEIQELKFSKESDKKFNGLEKTSADYIFAEKLQKEDAIVLLAEMGWSDVGEWIAFKEALAESLESNLVKGKSFDMDSKDTLIFNTEDTKLVATIGLNGMVVVNTRDVVAVFHKDDNTRIKEFIKKLEEEGLQEYL